jgi:fluoroquinolone transport system ATP-binding protein
MFNVKNVSFTYPKNKEETIKGISFHIEKGEIFGFLGPSGAGKSTTQKLLLKLLNGAKGDITFNGIDINKLKSSFYESIGVSFEMPIHFTKMTAYENIRFFQNLYEKKADIQTLMERVGLWKDKDKLVSEYSKGMKIRLNIVRALINKPDMLFLDEPTNGLDPKNAMILKDMIREYRHQGGTVFITSHIMSDIEQLCDRVAFIVDGKIVELARPRDLKIQYGKKAITVDYIKNDVKGQQVFDMENKDAKKALTDLILNADIETIHSGETTLEDIFIQVTGVSLTNSESVDENNL